MAVASRIGSPLPLAARTALAVGVALAMFAASVTHWVVVTAPLFAQSQEVPSVVDPAPAAQHAAAAERAREHVRAAIPAQNLPGVAVREAYFTPTFHKFAGQLCAGIEVKVTDQAAFDPIRTAVAIR